MATMLSCADGHALKRFLSGAMAEGEALELEEHLDSCPHCLEALQQLHVEDTLFDALRNTTPSTITLPPPEVINSLVEAANTLGKHADTATLPQNLDFLSAPQQPDEIGRLAGYRVFSVLGSGGMGIVFRAEDTQLRRLVALKVMNPVLASSASARRRFLREGQAAAAVKHDHVVTIYQVGEDRDLPFLAMEFLEGESLDDRLVRHGPLPLAEVLRIGREVTLGLAAVHAHGLIHRDIKPSNIWLETRGQRSGVRGQKECGQVLAPASSSLTPSYRVKILDFGIARPEQDVSLTRTDQVIGTPAYLAPEQARGDKVDARADLFNLGCILYYLCTGQRPFDGATPMAQLTSLATSAPQPIGQLKPNVPPALARLIMRLLAKDPADRPASAQAVAEALAAIEPNPSGHTPRARNPWRWLTAAAAILLLAGGSVLLQPLLIRITHKDGTVTEIKTDGKVEVVTPKENGKIDAPPVVLKSSVFDAFQRHQITTEELENAGGGHAKNAPAELVGILGDGNGVAPMTVLALHPDGKHLVWGDQATPSDARSGSVHVWDLSTRKAVAIFPVERFVASLSFSADGKRLGATVWRSGPAVFESAVAETLLNRPVRHFKDNDSTNGTALSPDGQRLAVGGRDGKVTVRDVDSGRELVTLDHGKRIYCFVFSSDGKRLATASTDGTAKIWDAHTGQNLHTLQGDGAVHWVAFSPNGARLAAAGRSSTKIWDAGSGQEIVTCAAPSSSFTALAVNPDGSLVATADGGDRVILWNSRSGKIEHEWRLPDRVWSLLFAPDGRHLLLGNTGSVYILRLKKL